jgi:DNA invertase Pin-like site-specific DNA recombinase
MMTSKIADQHLSRVACIYIRQSTPGQVRFNQESTERQYNLQNKAQSLGWSPEKIRILDRDLGQSATTNREDFKTLVGDVAMGQVGAIFSLEASRLARSNKDWHRLLEFCAITRTLVIDEDGCYDPSEFNDSLVLGMKGTFAQAELHIIRARLHGGKLNKARKGELKFPLPVGYVYDGDKIAFDPDQEVQGAVRTVFELFQREGTAFTAVERFNELGLRFPRRSWGGAWDGKVIWGRLTHSRVIGMLAIQHMPAPTFTDVTSLASKSRRPGRSTRKCVACRRTSGGSPCRTITRAISLRNNSLPTASVWRQTEPTLKSSQDRRARVFVSYRVCCCAPNVDAGSVCAIPAMAASTRCISAPGSVEKRWRHMRA